MIGGSHLGELMMDRPASIARFEQIYAGHIALTVLSSVINLFGGNPALAQFSQIYGAFTLPLSSAIAILTQLILVYAIARKGSSTAKWILVVFTAFNVLGLAFGLIALAMGMGGAASSPVLLGIGAVGSALLVASVHQLFKPDTPGWFGEGEPA